MSFDKFAQLEAAINTYGLRMSTFGKDDPHTKINHLMCMELIRDLKTERDAPSKFPGMVVRIDYKGEATPRTHVSTGRYETEPTYYRNDGLKAIPSRGMPT